MTINCRGKLLDLSSPKIMGILNITPDSFFDGGRFTDEKAILKQVEKMLHEGAHIIDIGSMSTRPGAKMVSAEDEFQRLLAPLESIMEHFPGIIISVDTIHSKTAVKTLEIGAHIINDISSGRMDENMMDTIAVYEAPYIIMHMKGTPSDMQLNPVYEDVVTEVFDFLSERVILCKEAGITDVIIDTGFGFGKSLEHNYTLLRQLKYFGNLNLPVLAGLSRKSMVCKPLKVSPEHALNGTTAANMLALLNGANILRVHDVKEAVETVKIYEMYNGS